MSRRPRYGWFVLLVTACAAVTSWHSSRTQDGQARFVAGHLTSATAEPRQGLGADEALGSLARFGQWAESYTNSDSASVRSALEEQGIGLARMRHNAMAELIRTNPERALKEALDPEIIEHFPAVIRTHLEQHIHARGSLTVLAALAEPGKEAHVAPVRRTANIDGNKYEAHVYGRRLGQSTRFDIPLHGVSVGHLLAVDESPVRALRGREAEQYKPLAKDAICGVSGRPVTANDEPVVVDVGGTIRYLCGANHINAFNDQQVAAEGDGPTGGASASDVGSSTWTEGLKKVILIRVDFPDLQGAPLSDSTGTNLLNGLHSFYNEMSYGKAGFIAIGSGSDITPTFRMPSSAAYYGTNDYYDALRSAARSAATAAGYTLSSYDRDVICMSAVPGFGWSGLAYIGAAGAWLRNSFATGVAGHELGHNWGLNHANYWDTSGQSVAGAGASIEYGDIFDTMGSASAGNNHFNARYKNYLNWLAAGDVATATSNGVYRIYAHDDVNSFGIRALRVARDASTNYWVEFRQKFTGNKWLMNGAGLRWAQGSNQRSQLLDTTPGSADGKNDSAVVIGRTFSDPSAGIHITPIGKGGTVPESLDVVVNLGTFPSDQPPVVSVDASVTNAVANVTLSFRANASDPDGDTLAYYWDFGDGSFGTNGPAASKSWSANGEYVVRCTVSDMKGGVASDSVIVVLGSTSTYRISGSVKTANGPVQGACIAAGARVTYTDSDGTYNLVGLPAGNYTVNAVLENYTFVPVGFANNVSVGPSRTNIDFTATGTLIVNNAPQITSQPASQTVNPGATVTFSVTATGSTPLYYQWRSNGANIAGATTSSYTKTSVQSSDAATYSVVVSNSVGTAISVGAILTISSLPVIATQPQNQTAIAGGNATFSVGATGTAPLSYQWRFEGTDIAGATASSYTRTNVQAIDAGNYSVAINNSVGSVTSAPAALAVAYAVNASATSGGRVTKSPDQASYALNSTVTLMATPTSTFPFAGWSGDGRGTNNPLTVIVTNTLNIVANFTSPVLDIIVDNPQATFSGTWSTVSSAADKYGANYRTASTSANSATATASFTPDIPATGRYDVYAWFPTITKGAVNVPFLISSSEGNLTVSINESNGSGGWRLLAAGQQFAAGTNGYVRIANNVGQGGRNVGADAMRWVYSENQLSSPPSITAQPANETVLAGAEATFAVQADGPPPLNFQWLLNGSALLNATNAALLLPGAQPINEGNYSVMVANAGGSVTSAVATLTVLVAPAIQDPPLDQTVLAGGSASFEVVATGTAPMAFQWWHAGDALIDATNATLILPDAQAGDAGFYTVIISNSAGAASGAAMLTVLSPPEIIAAPQSQRVIEGSNATFTVSAIGSAPLTYQWRFNTISISGATNAMLALPNIRVSDAGDYDVMISNPAGATTSEAVALEICVRPWLAWIRGSNRGPQLVLTGTPGDRYDIQSSTNFADWSTVFTVTNTSGTLTVEAPGSNGAQTYYRGRLLP